MNTPVLVVGAGGMGRETIDFIRDGEAEGRYLVAGVLDDDPALKDHELYRGEIDPTNIPSGHQVILAVGQPQTRQLFIDRLGPDVDYATIVHPTALVSPSAKLGAGVIVGPFGYVGPGAVVEDHGSLNIYASVGHDATVGRLSVLCPYATLNGNAVLGEGGFMGTHASIGVQVAVGPWSKVAAGTVASRSCGAGTLVAGKPAGSRVMFRPPTEPEDS